MQVALLLHQQLLCMTCDRYIGRAIFEEKGELKWIQTEVPLLTSLMPYRWAKPAHTLCVPGHDRLTFCPSFFLFFDWANYGPNIRSVKTCVLGPLHPLSSSVPAEAGHQFQLLLGHPCV